MKFLPKKLINKMVRKNNVLIFSVISLGFSAIVSQIIFMREFLGIFYGNELVFGIILSNWFLITGLGSYIGKTAKKIKNKVRVLIFLQFLISFLPILSLTFIRMLRIFIIPYGASSNLLFMLISSFFVLLPYCFISGFIFTLDCSIFSKFSKSKTSKKEIGRVYLFESIGSIIGGFVFSFILVFFFDSYQISFLLLFINLFLICLLIGGFGFKKMKYFVIFLILLSASSFFVLDFENFTLSLLFPNQTIISHKNSPYGKIVVTESENQLNFFENGLPLFSTENIQENEEIIHYPMLQHLNPRNVLLISGGLAGRIKELSKYNVTIDYVEIDPILIDLGKKYTKNLDYPNLNIYVNDGRIFVKFSEKKYDVIILDLPPPSTAQINRFYSLEFFKEAKRSLYTDGIFSLKLPSSPNYISSEIAQLNSIIYNTLSSVFKNVIVIPSGNTNYFIASDRNLSYDVYFLIKNRGIETVYVNENYLKGELTKERLEYVKSSLLQNKEINRDFSPIAYYYHHVYWGKQFGENFLQIILVLIFAIALLMIFFLKVSKISFAISTTGFAASSLEFLILLGFQIIYGYVYHYLGVIISFFMLGLCVGALYSNKTLKKRKLNDMIKIEFSIFIFSLIFPLILISASSIENVYALSLISFVLFPLLTFLVSFLVGMEFPIASKLELKQRGVEHTAGFLYASDLFGATIGSLLTATLLLPLFGLINTCIIISLLNLFSGLILMKK